MLKVTMLIVCVTHSMLLTMANRVTHSMLLSTLTMADRVRYSQFVAVVVCITHSMLLSSAILTWLSS